MLLALATVLATMAIGPAGSSQSQPEVSPLAPVFRVVMFPKHPRYELRLLPGPNVNTDTYLEAQCLLDPRALDPDLAPPVDTRFHALFTRLRSELDSFILAEVSPQLEPLDYNAAVSLRLNNFVQHRAQELGLVKLLQDGLEADATASTGCLPTVKGQIEQREQTRRTNTPLTYDVISLCPGTPGKVEDHLSFHPLRSWSEARAIEVLSILDTPAVRTCLASTLRSDAEAGVLAGNITAATSGFEYERAVSRALDVWKRAGVEDVLRLFEKGTDLDARRALTRLCSDKGK